MDQLPLQVQKRVVIGKGLKALRRAGFIPANLYGRGAESLALQVSGNVLQHALGKAGRNVLIALGIDGDSPRLAMVRNVQHDPRTHRLLHVDFYAVMTTEKITAEVPLVIVGEAPAVTRHNGILINTLTHMEVECFPQDIPSSLKVDVSGLLEIDQAVHVRDIVVPPGVTILADPEETVARVMPPRVLTAEEAAEAKVEKEPVEEQ